jgi:hypothetical protein
MHFLSHSVGLTLCSKSDMSYEEGQWNVCIRIQPVQPFSSLKNLQLACSTISPSPPSRVILARTQTAQNKTGLPPIHPIIEPLLYLSIYVAQEAARWKRKTHFDAGVHHEIDPATCVLIHDGSSIVHFHSRLRLSQIPGHTTTQQGPVQLRKDRLRPISAQIHC